MDRKPINNVKNSQITDYVMIMVAPSNPHSIVTQISKLIKELELCTSGNGVPRIEIPQRIVRTVQEIMKEYTFVSNETLKHNIAYSVEAMDFYRWLLLRFQVYGPVKSYIYKITVVLSYMIVEALVMDFLTQKGKKTSKKLKKNIPKLQALEINESLCEKIQRLHDRRSNIHLKLVSDLEANKYNATDWKNSQKCVDLTKKTFAEILF